MNSMQRFSQVDAFILAGGKGSRMGRDKASLEIAGKSLVARAAQMLTPIAATVTIVAEERRAAEFGLPVLTDCWPGAGPLGAIATALMSASNPWVFVLACDMPFVNADWLAWLFERAISAPPDSFDALVPATVNGLEPLCAIYRSDCHAVLTKAMEQGVRKVMNGLALLKIQSVQEFEWRRFSRDGSLFRNLNTWQDYLDARAALGG
jgi:molybdenum cofactor guanylyltransferase